MWGERWGEEGEREREREREGQRGGEREEWRKGVSGSQSHSQNRVPWPPTCGYQDWLKLQSFSVPSCGLVTTESYIHMYVPKHMYSPSYVRVFVWKASKFKSMCWLNLPWLFNDNLECGISCCGLVGLFLTSIFEVLILVQPCACVYNCRGTIAVYPSSGEVHYLGYRSSSLAK